MIQSSLESLFRDLQLLCLRLAQIPRFWRPNESLKLENFVSKFFVHYSNLLCTMYQKVGKPFADFTLFKVGVAAKSPSRWISHGICKTEMGQKPGPGLSRPRGTPTLKSVCVEVLGNSFFENWSNGESFFLLTLRRRLCYSFIGHFP